MFATRETNISFCYVNTCQEQVHSLKNKFITLMKYLQAKCSSNLKDL